MASRNGRAFANQTHFRCAVYTRKSTDDGLEQEFNSLDAQRDSGEAFIKSQAHEGWVCLPDRYDDGGFTGGNMERPAIKRLMADIEAGRVDCVVVYKVDRLSRSLLDFARMMEVLDKHKESFVSVTQQFNTAASMGRLILNVLLSFAQFEREMISERTRDKIAATRRKGKWSGGAPILGYNVVDMKLVIDPAEADQVRQIYSLYLKHEGLLTVVDELNRRGWCTKQWTTRMGTRRGGKPFTKNSLYDLLRNSTYIGKVRYKDEIHPGEHALIIDANIWQSVQDLLQRNGRTGGVQVRNKFGAILKGLLHCSACGCSMTPSHETRGNKRYRYYVCTSAQKRGWKSCPAPSIPAGEIERFVVEQIKHMGRAPELIAETVRQIHGRTTERLKELDAEERRLQRELAEHHGSMHTFATQSAGLPAEHVIAQLADLQERIASTERRLTVVRQEIEHMRRDTLDDSHVAGALAQFDPVWEALTTKEQGRLLQLLIERIEFDGNDDSISIVFHKAGIKALADREFAGDAA